MKVPTKYNCDLANCYWWFQPHGHLGSTPVEPTVPRHAFGSDEEYQMYVDSCKLEKMVWYPEGLES